MTTNPTGQGSRKRKDPEQVLEELKRKTQAAKERLRKRDTQLKILLGAYYMNELKRHKGSNWYTDEIELMKNYFNAENFALVEAFLEKIPDKIEADKQDND